MHCAFAATPFTSDDWFILRMVKRKEDHLSIGFCPDCGKQDPRSAQEKPYTTRRKEIYNDLQTIVTDHPELFQSAPLPEPDSKGRPHAFKGFE